MAPLLSSERTGNILRLTRRQRNAGVILLLSYLVASWISNLLPIDPGTLSLAPGIALSALFLEGIELWPIVYVAALFASITHQVPITYIIIMPVAQTLQAVVGAYLLRSVKIDPLFRRATDTFYVLGVVFIISSIAPTFGSITSSLSHSFFGINYAIASWGARYTATLFGLIILTPFLLRWFAKPRFSRKGREFLELLLVFGVLLAIDIATFVYRVTAVHGVSLVYFLLIPLFWIALRMRPRFVTLAMLLTSIIAVYGEYVRANALSISTTVFSQQLLQIETFIIVLASIFFVVVSLEEDRRLNSNLMRSQLATLQNAIARISTESKAKNDFIAVLAHELRNPLAPVVSAIDLLRLKDDLKQEEVETLDMMQERMLTVRRLLDDLLDISRVSEGKISINKEYVKLDTILRNAILSTEHHFKERHQHLELKNAPKPILVEGDIVRLEQIFSNLLTNASKYSHSGDVISITVRPTDTTVEVAIADHGVGIPEASLAQIFAPFHQIEMGSRTKKGLGIGLALVKSFVEVHNGSITAVSEGEGKGSIFTVTLPIAVNSLSEELPETKQKRENTGEELVLIADDNDAAAWDIGKLLELRRRRVIYAYDGEQALERMQTLYPSTVLLGLNLPDQDGCKVAEAMRRRGFKGKLIAIAEQGATSDLKQRIQESGFDDCLIRPISSSDLDHVI